MAADSSLVPAGSSARAQSNMESEQKQQEGKKSEALHAMGEMDKRDPDLEVELHGKIPTLSIVIEVLTIGIDHLLDGIKGGQGDLAEEIFMSCAS
ncbi:hypothetical protein CORC01_01241 [Colletotrichum orchidophilum]|uniref:Uncharacterized protein n=1 Tax=Colletotrichum orchidophilum TaxID=1209926 RepID=A0A1G4BPX6_9PEZI|nr:uncharacterized protein CORC01_01241 [Colletotrichum orchidophilum]OHF03522.1 hypothetical protein CORC01_01241 [Colletotrichum orchidophilum]